MSARLRISIAFMGIISVMLFLFGTYVYFRTEKLREIEFYQLLKGRATTALRFVFEAKRLPPPEQALIEKALLSPLSDEALLIHDADDSVLFSRADTRYDVPADLLDRARTEGEVRYLREDRQFYVLSSRGLGGGDEVAVASAVDREGQEQLYDLSWGMLIGGLIALFLAGVASYWYATWVLAPVRRVVAEAESIRDPSQRIPIAASHRHDELGSIATGFNELLARLDVSFQQQRSFVANVSHELRTPLTVLRGELHQAIQSEDPIVIRQLLRSVQDTTVHMGDMLSQLLWLAQAQAGTGALPLERTRLDEVAERAMDRFRQRYPHRTVAFGFTAVEEDYEPVVRGITVLLTAAIYNLLSNAAKYGGDQAIGLTLGPDPHRSGHLVTVSDQGPGMSPETLARVRGIFQRGADAPPLEGQGVGLALVERIAQVHHGELRIESAPGEGTRATLVLS